MKLAGGTHQHLPAASQRNGGRAIVGRDPGIGKQLRLIAMHLEAARDARIASGHRAHGTRGGLLCGE